MHFIFVLFFIFEIIAADDILIFSKADTSSIGSFCDVHFFILMFVLISMLLLISYVHISKYGANKSIGLIHSYKLQRTSYSSISALRYSVCSFPKKDMN